VTLLVDTNVWIATLDSRDPDHIVCSALVSQRKSELVSTVPVISETAWFIEDRFGPRREAEFVQLVTGGAITAIDLTRQDWIRCEELITTYASLRLGLVDASIVAAAERLGLVEIATMNARDFAVVRPRHADSFKLLPTET
jgi:uncharacterized protein